MSVLLSVELSLIPSLLKYEIPFSSVLKAFVRKEPEAKIWHARGGDRLRHDNIVVRRPGLLCRPKLLFHFHYSSGYFLRPQVNGFVLECISVSMKPCIHVAKTTILKLDGKEQHTFYAGIFS